MSAGTSLVERVAGLAEEAARTTTGHPLEADAREIAARLRRPLRVAIAGRAKAGKSTLLNALVGEQLAATDATECTRIVTWYREDLGYSVGGLLRNGTTRSFEFERSPDGLRIHLADQDPGQIERLEVGWPSSRLATVTLIDTPGLDAASRTASERTRRALLGDDDDRAAIPAGADAVIYLLRHLHRTDAEFLEAFAVRGPGAPSPVGAVALLSRCDEVGGGRPDALTSAATIAARYANDDRLRMLVTGVLPIAGLLAETGASLREDEVWALRRVAGVEPASRDALLLSVDRFRSAASPLESDVRERLLRRFGLFGLRFAVAELATRPDQSAVDLSRRLVEASGILPLEALIARSFSSRADVLKARSAMAALRALARRAAGDGIRGADALAGAVERTAAAAHELAELRVLELLRARAVALGDEEVIEVERLLDRTPPAERLGLPDDAGAAELQRASLVAIDRWRTRLGQPLIDRATQEAAEVVARTYEGLYVEVSQALA